MSYQADNKMHIFGRLAKIDRMCSKCKTRKPIRGGKVRRVNGRQVFKCEECDDCDAYRAHMAERERIARATRHAKPVLCLHKSCYQVVANLEEIKGFGNKGGFYR